MRVGAVANGNMGGVLALMTSYWLRHPVELLRALWAEVLQLASVLWRGYGWKEVCAADSAIAAYALPLVRELRKCKAGIPGYLFTEADGMPLSDEALERASAEWDAALAEIEWTLERIAKDDILDLGTMDEVMATERRVEAGLQLFAKHFRSLWT